MVTELIASMPILFRQFDPFSGSFNFRDLIYSWEYAGVFDFLLPFLLMFAVVFAILQNSRVLGDNRGVNILISLVLGLFVIRFPFVSEFFSVIFANLGIALAGLVVFVILLGLFVNEQNRDTWMKTAFWTAVGVIAIVVIASINQFYWFGSYWWQRNWTNILWIALLVIAIGGVVNWKKKESPSPRWEGEAKPIRAKLYGG